MSRSFMAPRSHPSTFSTLRDKSRSHNSKWQCCHQPSLAITGKLELPLDNPWLPQLLSSLKLGACLSEGLKYD